MDAGKLDRRITIERATVTTDVLGGEVLTWGTLATVWAQVIPVSDGERWRAEEVAATATHWFRIRWGVGVMPTDRIVYEGDVYLISGVKEIGRHDGQEITASARAE